MKRAAVIVMAFACGVTVSRSAEAKRGDLTLRELVEASDVVVVARVDSVTVAPEKSYWEGEGWTTYPRTATARVLASWIGGPMTRVTFSATKTWTCDTSYAEPGETVVLFLSKRGEDGVRNIVNSGQGRFEVQVRGGADYVKLSWHREFGLPGTIEVPNPARGWPDGFVDVRTFEKAVHGGLTEAPAEADPLPGPPNWLAPTGWPVAGSAIVLADIALAAVVWRLARRRRQHLGGAARWPTMLAGSAIGAWLACRQIDLLLALPHPANEPDIPMVHLIWPLTMLASGLLAWLAGEITAGPSRRPLLAALCSCIGSAAVPLWFLFDPPVALTRVFAHFLGLDIPQTLLAGLASAIAYAVLRGGDPKAD